MAICGRSMRMRVTPDFIRSKFSDALSDMYRREVPLYAQLLDIVRRTNERALAANPGLWSKMAGADGATDYNCEPHCAIRVGTSTELSWLRRVFAIMGMYPVGYYDLSVAGVPVHSCAFRPTDRTSLEVSPLRVFTSLLRLELIGDEELRRQAAEILATRQILSDRALELVSLAETEGGLSFEDGEEFVGEVLETFRWQDSARVTAETYERLNRVHRLVADVVSFKGPHINHLTPRTLDIDSAQAEMLQQGLKAKAVIEGPPRRHIDILLRQTSFQALSEPIRFLPDGERVATIGSHTARFGEIEQRGAALTRKGRALYDRLLADARGEAGATGPDYAERLESAFAAFPDDADTLRKERLAYFYYEAVPGAEWPAEKDVGEIDIDRYVDAGQVSARPIIYEDFLPVSAAGIFQSNLGGTERGAYEGNSSQEVFETALGVSVLDPFELYHKIEVASRDAVLQLVAGITIQKV